MRFLKKICTLVCLAIITLAIAGCSVTDSSETKVADIDFTVVEEKNLPAEVKQIIEEKKAEEFRVVFTAKENMYIAIGYGEKSTSGYSISVKDLYLTEDSIRIDTNLIGPQKGETINEEPTYPYIVVMIENMDYPVIFD